MTYHAVTSLLAEQSGTRANDWFLVSRARYGMEVVFRALTDVHGQGEIVTQPFTCVTAINPVLAAGHVPRYADIHPDSLSVDPVSVQELLRGDTRAVVVQHSFGMEAPLAEVRKLVDRLPAVVIEDAAHRPAAPLTDTRGRVIADITVCSFGAEKMYGTRFGGAIYLNPAMRDTAIYDACQNALASLPGPSWYDAVREQTYPFCNGILNRLPTVVSQFVRTLLIRIRLLRSPIVPLETTGFQAEPAALPSNYGIRRMYQALHRAGDHARRRNHVAVLQQSFGVSSASYTVPKGALSGVLPLVRFPVLARDAAQAEAVLRRIQARGYFAGKWYRPLFFPGVGSYETYHYTPGSCPIAEDVAARIVNIPTLTAIPPNDIEEIRHAFTD